MDAGYNQYRSINNQSNRWMVPVGAILLGVLVIGLATMFVAPMFRKSAFEQVEDKGQALKKRSKSAVSQIKGAVEDATETIQDQADKVKRAARKKIK